MRVAVASMGTVPDALVGIRFGMCSQFLIFDLDTMEYVTGGFEMSSGLPKCKIAVLKRTLNQDLVDEYLDDSHKGIGLCECCEDGQEFVVEPDKGVPDGFCAWAWADIRSDILTVAYGGDMPGMRKRGTVITGCTDWFRPVIFKVERMD